MVLRWILFYEAFFYLLVNTSFNLNGQIENFNLTFFTVFASSWFQTQIQQAKYFSPFYRAYVCGFVKKRIFLFW